MDHVFFSFFKTKAKDLFAFSLYRIRSAKGNALQVGLDLIDDLLILLVA